MVRAEKIVSESYYHVYLRGNNKQVIFRDVYDYIRFLSLLLFIQSETPLTNYSRICKKVDITRGIKVSSFGLNDGVLKDLVAAKCVDLINFTLMPNHFHMTVYEKSAGGISQYMQRVLNAYTKYYNVRHDMTGHLFAGPYQYRRIVDENDLVYLSAYIHWNIRELAAYRNKETEYMWSSLTDYVNGNRWGNFLISDPVLERFDGGKDYYEYVKESGAKALVD